ncbi:hypothetical protein NNO_1510 [Hydrogenimonas sp.]|nr:hypothetical protein NNO_1510 [Hydrogenimonas sp.]
MNHWFTIQTAPRYEKRVVKSLQNLIDMNRHPALIDAKMNGPIPGYVYICVDTSSKEYKALFTDLKNCVPGFVAILGDARYPIPLPEEEAVKLGLVKEEPSPLL